MITTGPVLPGADDPDSVMTVVPPLMTEGDAVDPATVDTTVGLCVMTFVDCGACEDTMTVLAPAPAAGDVAAVAVMTCVVPAAGEDAPPAGDVTTVVAAVAGLEAGAVVAEAAVAGDDAPEAPDAPPEEAPVAAEALAEDAAAMMISERKEKRGGEKGARECRRGRRRDEVCRV